jgi:iron complex outermembrane receptor protein
MGQFNQILRNQHFRMAPISAAVASAVTAAAAPSVLAQEELALEEVIVTARKRSESVQDIPASVQAMSGDEIRAIGARGMEDYSRFMSSINVLNYGNGETTVIFRGADNGAGYLTQGTSSVYLDEISLTTLGAQPSVRAVDLARVEALAGPQGTIYGSDAQAGTLRMITNKPVMNEFEVVLDGAVRTGSDSDESYDGSIVLNLPIIDDTLALRVVAFGAKDGGFVDNVLGHTGDTGVGPSEFPAGWGELDNADYVEDDWNDADVEGVRGALKWDINEDWSATLGVMYQHTDSGADNFYDPYVGDLEVVRFFDNDRDDEYTVYSLTIEADVGFAQLVSATAYYDRDIKEHYDITTYHKDYAAIYCQTYDLDPSVYYWYYANPDGSGVVWWPHYCLAPTVDGDYLATNFEKEQHERFSQEIRLFSAGDTFDWLVGIFYEDASQDYQSSFGRPQTNDIQDSIAIDWWEFATGNTFPEGQETWYSESDTSWDQVAVFGEVVWHLSDKMDLTLGGRYFDYNNENSLQLQRPRGNRDIEAPYGEISETEKGEHNKGDGTEFAPKVALSYHFTDDVMGYGLISQGYRMGGTNRTRGKPLLPAQYDSDKMTNYEVGVRSTLMGGAARVNLTAFYMDWEDYLLDLTDPSATPCPDPTESIDHVCGQPWQVMLTNAGDAHIAGVSGELDWAVSQVVTLGVKAEWLEAENDEDIQLGDVYLEKGLALPYTPEWNGSAYINMEWPIASYGEAVYSRLQWAYQGSSVNKFEPTPADGSSSYPQLKSESYNSGDLFVGVRGSSWDVSLFVNNLTDERGIMNIVNYGDWASANLAEGRDHTQTAYVVRPREYGIRFVKRWGG